MTTLIAAIRARLDELQAICDAATGEPWGVDHASVYGGRGAAHRNILLAHLPYRGNTAFIATSRTVTPQLIALTRRLVDLCASDEVQSRLTTRPWVLAVVDTSLTIIAEELGVKHD